MPRPLNERQALEQERAERREFLMWQIRQEKLTAGGDRGKAGHAQLQGGRVTRAQRAGLRLEGVPRPSLATRIRRYKRRPTLLRLCRDCQRVVIATTTKLLNTKLKAHRRTCRLVGRPTDSVGHL